MLTEQEWAELRGLAKSLSLGTITVTLPTHPVPRLMSGVTEGIHPSRMRMYTPAPIIVSMGNEYEEAKEALNASIVKILKGRS